MERTFQNIRESQLSEADKQSYLVSIGWSKSTTWEELLQSKRVLMISEAGAGKTYECREQAKLLWNAGEPAFFVELTDLASANIQDLLSVEEEARLNLWLSSQSDVATFFLDSIDELKLSSKSFESALKRLNKGINSQLGRARIVITTRPIAFDEQLVRRLLPIPQIPSTEPSEEAFAKIAMRTHHGQQVSDKKEEATADWRTVALMPLSDTQIVEFAQLQSVKDPTALLSDLQKRNALEFARRPQDLIELCADWNQHKYIRTHHDQVATNVRIKLQQRDDRSEPAELSVDKAIEGASRLALAMLVTRRLTIRHSAAADSINEEAALDPAVILSDWNPNERKALLERPLFGFASYGRVRFHHRSVAEYLAAERLWTLRGLSMPFRALKRLLFAETKSKIIVRPSKRPIAGWLALKDNRIFEMLRDNEPAVILNEGDPESLTPIQRIQALRAYVERYGKGGWRGQSVPHIQIHRFASSELASEINRLWDTGVENPDVRHIVLYLIESGRINECTDIAYGVATNPELDESERGIALSALVALEDPRLKDIASAVTNHEDLWSDEIASNAILSMFPRNFSVKQLCQTLGWMKQRKRIVDDLSWHLPRLIQNAELDPSKLEMLRDGLVNLISDGLSWSENDFHIVSNRAHLSGALEATCLRGLNISRSVEWLHASILVLRLNHDVYSSDEMRKALQERLTSLSAEENARLFWAADSLMQSLYTITDPRKRLWQVMWHDSPIKLNPERDLTWIKNAISNTALAANDRAMLFEAALQIPVNRENWRDHLLELKPLVTDQIDLLSRINEGLKPSPYEKDQNRWEKDAAKRKKQRDRQEAKNLASWIQFWREIASHPERAFSSEHSFNTAWSLWTAMSNDGKNSRVSGWNRRFIEEQFGQETADRLRLTLMNIWRQDYPTLQSERTEGARNITLVKWQLGLAALYAEAEDPEWAVKLTEKEAKLAARYAPIELNELPSWLESLIKAHPMLVDSILGNELSLELNSKPGVYGHSMLLQSISYAPNHVAMIFLPRLKTWLDENRDIVADLNDLPGIVERLRQIISVMLKYGDEDIRTHLLAKASQRLQEDLPNELILIWLPTLMRINPELGVVALEDRIRIVKPEKYSEAVTWFSVLFGDRHDGINLRDTAFTPNLLLQLLHLTYYHVNPSDDANHDGAYTPDIRDNAEHGRNQIVSALLDMTGEEGWKAKLEMAKDPFCAHFKDRILAVAEENWAQEIDSIAFDDTQAITLDKTGEAPASTNEAMYNIMCDRLTDIDDLLKSDSSPRELWASINKEKLMRREITRVLTNSANGLYKVNQETVTADEKETDIRLHSVVSDHEAVIELKLADNRTASDLRNTIYDQLVNKYMAPENRRSGCLLITIAKDRQWEHPDSGNFIGLTELESLLRDEAQRVENNIGGSVAIAIHILDLRPRLPKEKVRKTRNAIKAKR